jgi:hypothetical protein
MDRLVTRSAQLVGPGTRQQASQHEKREDDSGHASQQAQPSRLCCSHRRLHVR